MFEFIKNLFRTPETDDVPPCMYCGSKRIKYYDVHESSCVSSVILNYFQCSQCHACGPDLAWREYNDQYDIYCFPNFENRGFDTYVRRSKRVKTCPYCASKNNDDSGNKSISVKSSQGYSCYVICNDCNASGPIKWTIEEAISAWNEPEYLTETQNWIKQNDT